MPDEILLFQQSDSEERNGVPHCAFELPVKEVMGEGGVMEKEKVRRRESIEVRIIAYFKK